MSWPKRWALGIWGLGVLCLLVGLTVADHCSGAGASCSAETWSSAGFYGAVVLLLLGFAPFVVAGKRAADRMETSPAPPQG